MNPGVAEEAGQTARTTVDALKSQPLALAMIVVNVLFLGVLMLTAYLINHRNERIDTAQLELIAKLSDNIMRMTTECGKGRTDVTPNQTDGNRSVPLGPSG